MQLSLAGSSINEHVSTILIGVVQLASNIAALFVVDKFGRKPLLIISAVVMALSTGSMGAAFYLKQTGNHSFGFVQTHQGILKANRNDFENFLMIKFECI